MLVQTHVASVNRILTGKLFSSIFLVLAMQLGPKFCLPLDLYLLQNSVIDPSFLRLHYRQLKIQSVLPEVPLQLMELPLELQ